MPEGIVVIDIPGYGEVEFEGMSQPEIDAAASRLYAQSQSPPMAGPIPKAKLAAAGRELLRQEKGVEAAIPRGIDWRGVKGVGQGLLDIPRGIKSMVEAGVTPPQGTGEQVAAAAGPGGLLAKRAIVDPVIHGEGVGRIPIVGGAIQEMQQAEGGLPEAMGRFGTNLLTGTAGPKVLGKVKQRAAVRSVVKAQEASSRAKLEIANMMDPGKKGGLVTQDLDVALPKIVEAAGGKGKIANWRDLASAAKESAKIQGEEFAAKYIEPVADQALDYGPVGEAIRSRVTPDFARTAPAAAKRIEKIADRHSGTITVREAHKALTETNNKLSALAKKSPAQMRITAADPAHGWMVSKAEALRKLLYEALPERAALENRLQGATSHVRDLAEGMATQAERTPRGGGVLERFKQSGAPEAAAFGLYRVAARESAMSLLREGHPDARFASAWKKLQISVPSGVRAVPAETASQATRGERLLPAPTEASAASAMAEFIEGGAAPRRGGVRQLPAAEGELPRSVRSFEPIPGELPAVRATTQMPRRTVTMRELREIAKITGVNIETLLAEAVRKGIVVRGGQAK